MFDPRLQRAATPPQLSVPWTAAGLLRLRPEGPAHETLGPTLLKAWPMSMGRSSQPITAACSRSPTRRRRATRRSADMGAAEARRPSGGARPCRLARPSGEGARRAAAPLVRPDDGEPGGLAIIMTAEQGKTAVGSRRVAYGANFIGGSPGASASMATSSRPSPIAAA